MQAKSGLHSLKEKAIFTEDGLADLRFVERGHPWVVPTRRTIKAVCADCNNGWMATLEEEFKLVLTGKMSGTEWRLTPAEHATVRRWVMKTGVAHEFTDGEVRLADRPVLDAIREGVEPPGTWYLGVARAGDDLEEGLDSSPVVIQLQSEDGATAFECVYAIQHLITIFDWVFVLRYTPCPVTPPARLDHDLDHYPHGAPVPLLQRAERQRKTLRRKLPIWGFTDVAKSDLWLHALSPDEGTILTCGADHTFRLVLQKTTTEADFAGYERAMTLVPEGRVARIGELQRHLHS